MVMNEEIIRWRVDYDLLHSILEIKLNQTKFKKRKKGFVKWRNYILKYKA